MNTLLIFAKLENYKFHFTLENKQKNNPYNYTLSISIVTSKQNYFNIPPLLVLKVLSKFVVKTSHFVNIVYNCFLIMFCIVLIVYYVCIWFVICIPMYQQRLPEIKIYMIHLSLESVSKNAQYPNCNLFMFNRVWIVYWSIHCIMGRTVHIPKMVGTIHIFGSF